MSPPCHLLLARFPNQPPCPQSFLQITLFCHHSDFSKIEFSQLSLYLKSCAISRLAIGDNILGIPFKDHLRSDTGPPSTRVPSLPFPYRLLTPLLTGAKRPCTLCPCPCSSFTWNVPPCELVSTLCCLLHPSLLISSATAWKPFLSSPGERKWPLLLEHTSRGDCELPPRLEVRVDSFPSLSSELYYRGLLIFTDQMNEQSFKTEVTKPESLMK